jgi:hypothetical protein
MILTAPDTLGIFDPLDPLRVRALAIIRSRTFGVEGLGLRVEG